MDKTIEKETEAILVEPKDENKDSNHQGTVSSSVYNLINGIMGSGILVLPMSIGKFGWFLGSLFLLLFSVISALTCYLLTIVYKYTDSKSYAGMGGKLYGKWAEYTINVIQVLYGLGALFSYTIIIADESHFIMQRVFYSVTSSVATFLTDRSNILIIISLCIVLPPALLPHITNLKYTSFFANICVVYLIIAIMLQLPKEEACGLADTAAYVCTKANQCLIDNDPTHIMYQNLTSCLEICENCIANPQKHTFHPIYYAAGAFFSIPFFCFSNTCQVQYIPILAEMKDTSKKSVMRVLLFSFTTIFVVYVLAGLSGYYSFCGFTTNNILDSYPIDNVLILVCRIAIVLDMCFSVPLFSHPLRSMILELMNISKPKYWMIAIITIIIIVLDAFVAIIASNLGTVLGITGAIGSSTIMMILPSIMYTKYLKDTGSKKVGLYLLSITILILGFVFAVLGTVATLQQN